MFRLESQRDAAAFVGGTSGDILAYPFDRYYLAPKRLAIAAAVVTSLFAGGCGHASLTPLPDLVELPIETIDPRQRQAAIKEMAEVRVKHQERAIDAIEKAR